MTNTEKEISGDREYININECVPLGFHHIVLYLFNRACQEENYVNLHPHSSTGGFLFNKVSPSDHSSGLLTVTLRPNSRAARLSWKRHHNHMKWDEGIPYRTVKRRGGSVWGMCACRAGRQAGNIYTNTHTHTRIHKTWADKWRQQEKVGWESSPEQLPARNSITTVRTCVKAREEEKERRCPRDLVSGLKCVSCMSDCCYLLKWFCVLLLMSLMALTCALHLLSCGSFGRRHKGMTHINLY